MVLDGCAVEGWAFSHNNVLTWPAGEAQAAGWLQALAAPGGTQLLGCLSGPKDGDSAPLHLSVMASLLASPAACSCLAVCLALRHGNSALLCHAQVSVRPLELEGPQSFALDCVPAPRLASS